MALVQVIQPAFAGLPVLALCLIRAGLLIPKSRFSITSVSGNFIDLMTIICCTQQRRFRGTSADEAHAGEPVVEMGVAIHSMALIII